MPYTIRSIELLVRETPPGRMLFSLGKPADNPSTAQGVVSPLGHVRMVIADAAGNETYGCAGDRLSVRWLDKRPGREETGKLRELVELIEVARQFSLGATFHTPFEFWQATYPRIMRAAEAAGQEQLSGAFAAALMERSVIDAFCRAEDISFFEAVKDRRLGFSASQIHPETNDDDLASMLPSQPRTQFWIRHTVGATDPLTTEEISPESRVGDGLPESLQDYILQDGVRYFKVKITGDVERDLERLERIWRVLQAAEMPVVTLDANEAYVDLDVFERFVQRFESELLGLFQHVAYIEQPLPRSLTLDVSTAAAIRRLAERKPLLIDEADGSLKAFPQALIIGYRGVSHKNCKGVFKSLANLALTAVHEGTFLSAEDLQNLPIVPLQQDFAALSLLDLEHCERNGHHYNYGLSILSEAEQRAALKSHPDVYTLKDGEAFLNIVGGRVSCGSLQCAGFGVADEPDWSVMVPMRDWLEQRHPAGSN